MNNQVRFVMPFKWSLKRTLNLDTARLEAEPPVRRLRDSPGEARCKPT